MRFLKKILFQIKEFFDQLRYRERFFILEEECDALKHALQDEIRQLKNKVGDPRFVVEKIFGRNPKYFDEQELTTESKRKYFQDAQMILNSTTFNNIVNRIIATQCQEQARQYNPQFPQNVARDVQMTLNALELLREELEQVPDPDKTPDKQQNRLDYDPYAPV